MRSSARAMQRVEFTWDPIGASLQKSAEAAHKLLFLRTPPELKGILMLDILNEVLKEKNLRLWNHKWLLNRAPPTVLLP